MLRVSCPGCGAPAAFQSHASVMAVCEYCRTVVLKDSGAVRELGKLSDVLEDYSPIQLGTAGVSGDRGFTVVGRIQLRYEAGIWNEWFLAFDDGGNGWLGDSSGRYVVTLERETGAAWPEFDTIRVGQAYELGAGSFIAAEKRVARCIGGQGELPFRVGDGWEARVADFRRGREFVTLDYSDGPRPVTYLGVAATLDEMRCQLLRDDEAIKASAGRYRGRVESLSCPHCGTAIGYLPGLTANIVCQSCRSQLDASTPALQVLKTGEAVAQRHVFTLPLGSTGTINGRKIRVLGAMRRSDDDGEQWSEYLLHDPRKGFSWLVETDEAWWRAEVMDEWPAMRGTAAAKLKGVAYTHLYDYNARVDLALGAFHWRVAAGDSVAVAEYQQGKIRLAAELAPHELTWSRSSRIAFDQVRAWFRLKPQDLPAPRASAAARSSLSALSRRFLIWLVGLNLIPLIVHFDGAAPWVFIGIMAIALPPFFLDDE
jgi:ribosomal protein S27E